MARARPAPSVRRPIALASESAAMKAAAMVPPAVITAPVAAAMETAPIVIARAPIDAAPVTVPAIVTAAATVIAAAVIASAIIGRAVITAGIDWRDKTRAGIDAGFITTGKRDRERCDDCTQKNSTANQGLSSFAYLTPPLPASSAHTR